MARKRSAGSVGLRLSLEDEERVKQALRDLGRDGEAALKRIEMAGPGASSGLNLVDSAVVNVTDRLDGLAGSAGGAGRVLSAAGPLGLAAGAAVGIMVSLGAATLNAARQISDLRREAERAGQSFESFQELAVIANRTGVQVDALADGMRELQLRADEFVQTDGGAGKEAFERLGFDRASVNAGLQDVDRFFDQVMTRVGELDQAAQIRVLDELFGGTAGEQFTRLLDEGVESFAQMREEARATGQVLSEEVGREAEELRRTYDEAANVLKVQMQQGLSNLMPLMTSLVGAAASFLGLINNAVDALGSGESERGLQARLVAVNERIALAEANEARQVGDLSAVPRSIQDATLHGTTREASLVQIRRELSEMRAERQRITGILNSRRSSEPDVLAPILPNLPDIGGGSRSSSVDREQQRLERLAQTYRRDLVSAIGLYELAIEDVSRLVDENLLTQEEALQVELSLRRELEQQLRNETQARLEAATDATSGAVRALNEIQQSSLDMASIVDDAVTNAFGSAEDALVDFVTTGKLEVGDLVNSIIADFARIAIRQTITGPLSGLLSSALGGFGGGVSGGVGLPLNLSPFALGGVMAGDGPVPLPIRAYASGGIANTPQLAMFGEGTRPEAYVPLPDGRTIPVTMQGAGSSSLVEIAIRVDQDGALRAFVENTSGQVAVQVVEANTEREARLRDRAQKT